MDTLRKNCFPLKNNQAKYQRKQKKTNESFGFRRRVKIGQKVTDALR